MISKFVFAQLVLVQTCLASVAQTCVWKDGSVASGWLPCTTDPSSATGSCCAAGEACLASGLCYSSSGIIYRGACLNTWGSGNCPTYCDDISDNWANFYACPFPNQGSSQAPESWYCGANGETVCVASNHSHIFTTIRPGAATKLLETAIATGTSTGTAITKSTSGATSTSVTASGATTSAEACPSSSNGVAIGLGVALGVVVLALCGIVYWAFRAHRKQKAQLTMMQTQSPMPQQYHDQKQYVSPANQYSGIAQLDSGSGRVSELPAPAA